MPGMTVYKVLTGLKFDSGILLFWSDCNHLTGKAVITKKGRMDAKSVAENVAKKKSL